MGCSMTRRERLLATLRGEPVDRPPVSFHELDGLTQNPDNPDPFNVYADHSWKPLLDLAREKTDRINIRYVSFKNMPHDLSGLVTRETRSDENGSRLTTCTIRAGRKTLTSRHLRNRDVDTTWCIEHLVKDIEDFKAWLDIPEMELGGEPDIAAFLEAERQMGDAGIVLISIPDPLNIASSPFDMGEFTVVALTEPALFHRALEKAARSLYWKTEAIAKVLPGRLWRITGPELASPPYLPPRLFEEYITHYDKPLVEIIHKHGGYARLHSHGRLRDILDHIVATGCMGLDPVEPPPQGDVELEYVRRNYGKQLVLFGNIEVSDIETLPTDQFARKVETALREGTLGEGRGFVLMPSACPIGRVLRERTLRNYEKMVEMTERFGG